MIAGRATRPALIDCGVIRLPSGRPLAVRLAQLHRELDAVVQRLEPTEAAVEAPFHGKSARAALQLAHARGVVLAVLASAGVEVVEYAPATVKQQVTGSGRADKEQVRRMMVRLLGQELQHRPQDLTDALAVGLCHLGQRGFHEAVARSGGAGD